MMAENRSAPGRRIGRRGITTMEVGVRRSIIAFVLVVGLWVVGCTQPAGGASSVAPGASAPAPSGAPVDSGGKYGY
jgi:hypothetical protein